MVSFEGVLSVHTSVHTFFRNRFPSFWAGSMKSINKRLNLIFVTVVTLVLVASGAINYVSAKRDLDAGLRDEATALIGRLKLSLPALLWNFDEGQIDKTIESEMAGQDILGILVKTTVRPLGQPVRIRRPTRIE